MMPLPCPPELTGTAEQQLRQLWDYVYQLVERLNAKSEFAELPYLCHPEERSDEGSGQNNDSRSFTSFRMTL